MLKLITCSDDRQGRKGGQYAATQNRILAMLGGWLPQYHYRLEEFLDCDPLMVNTDAAKNGRVYKPWCILDALCKLQEGEYLVYNDCSPELWPQEIKVSDYDFTVIERLTDEAGGILVGFVKWDSVPLGPHDLGRHTHRNFTLNSCMAAMLPFSGKKYADSFLCASGMVCIKKSEFTMAIVKAWLHYNRRPECACMNISEFEDSYYSNGDGTKLGNRHDQSVLSLLLNSAGWRYCDIVYNAMNPYNFLNFCLPGHQYKFINSNR